MFSSKTSFKVIAVHCSCWEFILLDINCDMIQTEFNTLSAIFLPYKILHQNKLVQIFFITFVCAYLCMWVWGHMCMPWHMWRSEARLWHLFLFFYQMGRHLRDQTQVVTVGGRCLYLVRYLAKPWKNSQYTNKFIDKRLKVTVLGERWEEDNPE